MENMLGRVETERVSSASARLWKLVFVSAGGRVLLGIALGLGVDESYEVVTARMPALSYFDHPPLSFWLAGGIARLFGTEQRTLLRLPFIALFALTTILLYRLTARLYGERAGLVAALLVNVSPVFSLSTGGWILPDGPLDCAMLAAALCLTRALLPTDGSTHREPEAWRWWIGAGVATGIALLSKYHGVFLLAGTLLYLVTRREARGWLRRPEPYTAAALALAIASPVVIWNLAHGFASVRFQAGRAGTHGVHPTALVQNVAGQVGYLLPWIAVPLLWQLGVSFRAGPRDAPRWLLGCLACGPILVFTLISLGGNAGLPHWPAPGYLLLFPLLGDAVTRYESRGPVQRTLMRRLILSAAIVFVILTAAAASAIATGWPTRVAPSLFRRGDPTIEAVDWRDLRHVALERGWLTRGDVVATTHWIDGAKVGYALGPEFPVLCLSDDPRGFQFIFPPANAVGRDALVVVRAGDERAMTRIAGYFESVQLLEEVPIMRAGQAVLRLQVYRGRRMIRALREEVTGGGSAFLQLHTNERQ
jgi:dolichyl-phosphate-mannose-protein mannosyltransferase